MVKGLLKDNIINKETHRYLTPQDPKAGRFYILPKIHKPRNPGRPIVSANGHPTEKISEFVSYHLNPLVQMLPSYIKNTTDLLNKLNDIDTLPSSTILVTLDVSSLYTNIPTNEALPNINKILRKKQPILHSTERLHEIYKEPPVVAYRRSPNLRDQVVRAKLKQPVNAPLNQPSQPHGTFRCNSKHGSLTCPHIENGRRTYTFNNTGEVREIKHRITCKSSNLTYMIECNKCKKQYIGETKRSIRERFAEHRQATNNPRHANASAAVPTHFNLPDHSIQDMTLIPLELQPTIMHPAERLERPT
ncbi:hypothetical protein ACROYT_G019009 [Oculina patagonica]